MNSFGADSRFHHKSIRGQEQYYQFLSYELIYVQNENLFVVSINMYMLMLMRKYGWLKLIDHNFSFIILLFTFIRKYDAELGD